MRRIITWLFRHGFDDKPICPECVFIISLIVVACIVVAILLEY